MRLLVVEDDARVTGPLVAALADLGHEAVVAEDGRAALSLATGSGFEAVLLDVMLPHVGGLDVVRLLRGRGLAVPILMMSALGEVEHRIAGLDAGADDYLVKPVAAAEIDARLRAIVRRAARTSESGVMRAGDIEVNEVKCRAIRAGRALGLPRLEFRVLCELIRHKNSVVTRQMFYRTVWDYAAEPATNIVESYIRRLRDRLNAPGEDDPIVTIRGIGYMLVEPVQT